MRWCVLDSPIGDLAVAADERGLHTVRFAPFDVPAPPAVSTLPAPSAVYTPPAGLLDGGPPDRWLAAAVEQLRAYFAGEQTAFELSLAADRGSPFERAVWAELSRIPYGQTRTYGEVATAAGDPGAARAVGVACNRNPLPIVVPCHRVVGAGGKLVGFGGGLGRKRFLLELEAGVAMRGDWI